jgi:hypothetical protein
MPDRVRAHPYSLTRAMRSQAYLAFKVAIVRLLIASNVTAKSNNRS